MKAAVCEGCTSNRKAQGKYHSIFDVRREVRTRERTGDNFSDPGSFTGHLRIRHKRFAFALADDYLEFGKSI